MKFNAIKSAQKSGFVPSIYQQRMFDWGIEYAHTYSAAVVNAVAGSGKSTSLREMTKLVSNNYDMILSLAFNSHIAKEGREKNTVPNVKIITYHSLGLSAIKKLYTPKIDESGLKVESIVKSKMMGNNKYFQLPSIKRLVSLCKGNAIQDPDNGLLFDTAINHDIELFDDQPDVKFEIFDWVRYGIQKSIETIDTIIDFDDMIFLPVILGLQPDQYDMVLADEFQDTNHAQAKLVQMARTGVMLGVGDPRQSIYAFRGADSNAMSRLVEEFDADQLPLSISYRCPRSVGDLVRKEFPEIAFETPEWAIDGLISETSIDKSLDMMQEGDIVISRINANLPAIAFSLIRKGKTARILGRDIGKSLKGIIEKQKATDLPELFTKLNEFREKQMSKFMALNKPDKISQLDDQLETISALSEGANSVWDVITRCQTMFSDDQIGISLGTIHKNKGREAKNVFITRPDLIPLPFVMQKGSEEDKIQELNGRYVACTRPTENLIFCQGEL